MYVCFRWAGRYGRALWHSYEWQPATLFIIWYVCLFIYKEQLSIIFLYTWNIHQEQDSVLYRYISNRLIISRINFILQIHKGHTYEKCCLLKILWSAIHLTALSLQCFEVEISQRDPWKKIHFHFSLLVVLVVHPFVDVTFARIQHIQ